MMGHRPAWSTRRLMRGQRVATIVVKRPLRRAAPAVPSGEVILDPPPENPPPGGRRWSQMMMILPMVAGTAAMGLMMGMGARGPLAYIAGGMYGASILGMVGVQLMTQTSGPSKSEMIEARRKYMRTLSHLRAQVNKT